MMKELLKRLTKRKTEVFRKVSSEWQQLVIDAADEREIDPDAVLDELDRLNKSPEELATAVALLDQRRAWAQQIEDGNLAEAAHPKAKQLVEAKKAELTAYLEKHQAEMQPLEQAQSAARFAMTVAADARRELARTATDPIALQTVREADAKLAELGREKAEHGRNLLAMQDRLKATKAQEAPDIRDHEIRSQVDRLARDIEAMQEQGATFDERARQLTAECESAREALLRPEAI